jgi:hypothetical protein
MSKEELLENNDQSSKEKQIAVDLLSSFRESKVVQALVMIFYSQQTITTNTISV